MRYVLIGGTGTLGKALIKALPTTDPVLVLSRDELKQKQVKEEFPHVTTSLCDVRDKDALKAIIRKHDHVFHLAALKHVDVAEDNIEETIKTNIFGLLNVAQVCHEKEAQSCVFSSTDKAVLPINAYGFTKALGEKIIQSYQGRSRTVFSVFRWGNVFASRGSVIHSFLDSLKKERRVYITNMDMTRFWINIDEAARFMLAHYLEPKGHVMIPKMKSASVFEIAKRVANYLGINNFTYEETKIRKGEKIHECLESNHAFCLRSDTAEKYTDEEIDMLIRKSLDVC